MRESCDLAWSRFASSRLASHRIALYRAQDVHRDVRVPVIQRG